MIPISMVLLMAAPQIVEVTAPQLTNIVHQSKRPSLKEPLEAIINDLKERYGPFVEEELKALLSLDFDSPESLAIYQELATGAYDEESVRCYLHFATKLLLNHLSGGALEDAKKVEAFVKELKEPYELKELSEEERGHNHAWVASKNNKSFAFFKQSVEVKVPPHVKLNDPLCFSSFLPLIPDMPLTTTVTEFERIGYEMDALFGFDMAPPTLQATFQDGHKGIIQPFIADGEPISNFIYQKDRLKELATLAPSKVQLACLSGIFKGVGAHHIDNYLMIRKNGKVADVKEVDLEEIMPPYNRSEKPIVLCRLALLGLPQAKTPLEKPMLMILTHPSFQIMLEAYHKTVKIDPACLHAQKERLDMIQELCKTKPNLTVRDIYFAIFGGENIYHLAKQKGYADISAFNNVVSDPYQHVIKDIYNPSQMKPSDGLKPIQESDSEEDKIRKSNLQSFEQFYLD